jgi:peptide/nickel transport system permease protein
MSPGVFLIKRVLVGLALYGAVLTLIFLAVRAVPGDPALQVLGAGEGATVTEEQLDAVRQSLGLDQPLHVQYLDYLGGAFVLDLGTSFRYDTSVTGSILARMPATAELLIGALLLALVLGVPLGALAARARRGWEAVMSAVTSVAVSVPVYVIGVFAVLTLSLQLHLFPPGGRSGDGGLARLESLVLPCATLALPIAAQIIRMTYSSVRENLDQDWVRTSRALGLSEQRVFRRDVLRNSLTPVASLVGLQLGILLGSTVLVERVFNWPGISSLLIDAISARDYPMVQGIVIFLSLVLIVVNIGVDVVYRLLDPRIRRSAR